MRKLIIVRGPSGTGKSTLVREAGLETHHLSGDKMLWALGGPVLANGRWQPNMDLVHKAWEMVRTMAASRMQRGETFVLEGTFGPLSELQFALDLARQHRYQVMIIDTFGPSVDDCIHRQGDRTPEFLVGRSSLERQFERYAPIPADLVEEHGLRLCMTHQRPIADVVAEILDFVRIPTLDLSHWERVVFIGDLQGCASPLTTANSPVADIADNTDSFYVFTGDLIDRGIENADVLQWAIDFLLPKVEQGRALLIWGNHEDHLVGWANGETASSAEFVNRTAPQLDAANIDPAKVRRLLVAMVDAALIRRGNEILILTHGGLGALSHNLANDLELTLGRLPSVQATKGVGHYGVSIDTSFADFSRQREALTGERLVQVHGHRNSAMLPTSTDDRSFNLEGQAEFGGHVRFATVSAAGWSTHELPVTHYASPAERQDIDRAERRKPFSTPMPIAPWSNAGQISQADIKAFGTHQHIRIQPMGSKPHISTIAFTKSAFYGKIWDELTTRARGLFVNTTTGEIVSRAYDKFFNLGERPETELSEVLQWSLPIKARHKYNGFLGIAGYDSETNELVLSSKSMIDGEFADMFREIALAQLGTGGLERLRRACRDQAGSAIFEVIDPVRDPHMVEYDQAHIVLLDFVHRAETFAKLDDAALDQMGRYIGVPVRDTLFTANHPIQLERQIAAATTADSSLDRRHIEGLVLEDADGRIVKIKTPWYSTWKRARQLGEQILLARRKGLPFTKDVPPELVDYIAWAQGLSNSQLDRPIIDLRRHFLAGTLPAAGEDLPPEPKRDNRVNGLIIGMDQLALRREITAESARRLFARVTDDVMRAAFDAHPLARRIRELAEEA